VTSASVRDTTRTLASARSGVPSPTPALVPLWTAIPGAGGRPDGFTPTVGTKFRLRRPRPKPGWRGVVDCEVLEVTEPSLLRYSLDRPTVEGRRCDRQVALPARAHAGGTRFTSSTPRLNRRRRGLHGQA